MKKSSIMIAAACVCLLLSGCAGVQKAKLPPDVEIWCKCPDGTVSAKPLPDGWLCGRCQNPS